MSEDVSHLVFDCESIADGALIAKVRYPGQSLSPQDAIARYQSELMEEKGTTFIPYTFQVPIAVVVAKVSKDFRLIDIVSLDEPNFRSHVITAHFWKGWEIYKRPQWVTFNGRTFDLPLMELAAYRFGISIAPWFKNDGYRSPRNRFSVDSHLDLQDLLTNFSASRFNGGLNLATKLLGKPGKMSVTGDQVQQQYDDGDLKGISDYCRCDVLDTYFVFLRSMVLSGKMTLEKEVEITAESKAWIEAKAADCEAYATYLEHWEDWSDPWESDAADAEG
ncbi:putative 3'-5' exonuclease related to the exonuclease domain of PolB [Stieleria neptunia]|uniref:Putative 3'-5' exonuclease related to the exonuclease domain of PolB n=1 Tax=Stieleria neptunia TaxID=2527979 RepID=A0A518HHB9_9BACT|nr:3'-5' exonuclease [Stieleria neptunia]QDV40241.1 putative 3'-5' exonuclease related to the exonuclease domain of PolB [Stieleria neptunia]